MSKDSTDRNFVWSSLLVCSILFVDVPVPLVGTVLRLLSLPVLLCVMATHRDFKSPSLRWLAFLIVPFFSLPYLAGKLASTEQVVVEILTNMVFVLAAYLAARTLLDTRGAQTFGHVYSIFACASGAIAAMQRFGVAPPLGRDLWGRATTTFGSLRGTGFLSDPNFLAVLLASALPFIAVLEGNRKRIIAFSGIAIGLFSTDSRAGFILAAVALVLMAVNHRTKSGASSNAAARRFALAVGMLAVLAMVLNIGNQRDRVVDGLTAALEGQTSSNEVDQGAAISAVDRREYLEAWVKLGAAELPFGAGPNAQQYLVTASGRQNAAHNNFAQLFGMGGVSGIIIGAITLIAAVRLFRHRSDAASLGGLIIILGGLFLSFPGTLLLAFPLGIADRAMLAKSALGEDRRSWSTSNFRHSRAH